MSIYITQLVYVKKGAEDIFHEFENIAIPLIEKYNGHLLLRIRPGEACIIGHGIAVPYEVHLVEFLSEADLENFKQDETRKQFLHLKDQSIESVFMIKGEKV